MQADDDADAGRAEMAQLVGELEQLADIRLDLVAPLAGARCIGACGLAPATVIDGDVLGKSTSETVTTRLLALRGNARPEAEKGGVSNDTRETLHHRH